MNVDDAAEAVDHVTGRLSQKASAGWCFPLSLCLLLHFITGFLLRHLTVTGLVIVDHSGWLSWDNKSIQRQAPKHWALSLGQIMPILCNFIYYYINHKVWGSHVLVNVSQMRSPAYHLFHNLKTFLRKENFFIAQ